MGSNLFNLCFASNLIVHVCTSVPYSDVLEGEPLEKALCVFDGVQLFCTQDMQSSQGQAPLSHPLAQGH